MPDSKTSLAEASLPEEFSSFVPVGKQQRAQETRKHLVDAAREIFARDGFELARLEDIAAAAGKTRGAFYAHFRDKEDVFLAIFEQDIRQDQARMLQPLREATSGAERIEILVQHLASLINDRRRMLLNLEFKGYAIRHPRRKKRLADLIAAMCVCCGETRIDYLIPELRQRDDKAQRKQAAQFGALVDGLALSSLFDPENMDHELLLRMLRGGVKTILDLSDGWKSEKLLSASK